MTSETEVHQLRPARGLPWLATVAVRELFPHWSLWLALICLMALNLAWIGLDPRLCLAPRSILAMLLVGVGTPLALAGYSFGAWCACNVAAGDPRVRAIALVAPGASMPATLDGRPIAIAHPENDHITHPQVLADWLQSIGGGELAVIHGADHYLRDRAGEVSDYLGDFLARALTTSDN